MQLQVVETCLQPDKVLYQSKMQYSKMRSQHVPIWSNRGRELDHIPG